MKRAKFYCENCRREVRWDARVCPNCGRFFSAVKCPRCGFTGKSDLFRTGCPACGYADADPSPDPSGPGVETYDLSEVAGRRSASRGSATPPWFFALFIGLLAVAFLVLVLIYNTL